jgi:hypothetical protein
MLRGILGRDVPGQVLCYEPAPGVGAALIAFEASASPADARTAPLGRPGG